MPKWENGKAKKVYSRVSYTLRDSDEVKLWAEARRLSRIFGSPVNRSQAVRYLLEKLPPPDPEKDPDLFSKYMKAIEEEGGAPAIQMDDQRG